MSLGRRLRASLLAAALVAGTNAARADDTLTFRSLDGVTELTAHMRRPPGDEARPAVVLLHGCSGLLDRRGQVFGTYRAWARTLAAKGYVALTVDSATPRGFGPTCNAGLERRTMIQGRPKDAYAALRYLQAQPFVQSDRIALMGWSQGGGIVLAAVNEKSIDRPPDKAPGFRAAIAFYPGGCRERPRPVTQVEPQRWTTRIPLLVLMGESDIWTRSEPCRVFLDAAKERGSSVEFKSYPGASHGFDAPNQERLELPAYTLPDGTVPVIGTEDGARADAILRAMAFLGGHLAKAP